MLHVGHDDVSSTVEQVNSNGSNSPRLSPQQYRSAWLGTRDGDSGCYWAAGGFGAKGRGHIGHRELLVASCGSRPLGEGQRKDGGGLGCPMGPGASWGCVQQLPEAEGFPPHSHPVHVKEEPAEAEDDSRPVSLMATTNQNVTIPDDRDLEEELPVEDLS